MNFEFLGDCRTKDSKLREMYEEISRQLSCAEDVYWENPQECGIILRGVAERICRVYNHCYEIGFSPEASIEEFLCYADDEEHNAMVSRFLSVVRTPQRERLTKLRVLGNDCIQGEERDGQGVAFGDRVSSNAKRMMEAMMETAKEMCIKINGRMDLTGRRFDETILPRKFEEIRNTESRGSVKAFFVGLFAGKRGGE